MLENELCEPLSIYPIIFLVDKAFDNGKFQKMLSIFRERLNTVLRENEIPEFLVMSFDSGVNIEKDFCPDEIFEPPVLTQANGSSAAMNQGIMLTLDIIESRKSFYNSIGLMYSVPELILVVSRIPTDSEHESKALSALEKAISVKDTHYALFIDDDSDITPKQLEKYLTRCRISAKTKEQNIREFVSRLSPIYLSVSLDKFINENKNVLLPELSPHIIVSIE